MKVLGILARVALGVIFLVAAWGKIADPASLAKIIHNYNILPDVLINPAALVLPWVEVVIGVCLVTGYACRGASLFATVLLIVFIAAMIANGMFITPERASRIAFSLPYSRTAQGLLTRRGNPKGLHAYADVAARSDVVAAVLAGSIEQQTLLRLGMSPSRLFVVPEPADGLAAVRQGRADCLALSAPTVAWMADNAPEEVEAATPFRGPGDTLAVGRSAFGFRREDVHLRRAVDQALLGYIGTPEQLRRVQPFGFGPPSLPEWRPAP